MAQKRLDALRLHIASELGLMKPGHYECLWVVSFSLLEQDEETQCYYTMHHPFTAPKPEGQDRLKNDPGSIHADAYDMVINDVGTGGSSIRVHDTEPRARVFAALGFTKGRAKEQFGFLTDVFKHGVPSHGGIAFGLDRWVLLMAELDSIRDYIAFPENNSGRDVMIDTPTRLDPEQLDELHLTAQETL